MKLRVWWLLGCLLASQAQAGLFDDDEARKRIQNLEARLPQLEGNLKEQASSLLDLQAQIETMKAELRVLRGQSEEFSHNLQDAEKRQRDFYVDLDTRLRRFEVDQNTATDGGAAAVKPAGDDLATENRTLEAAFGLYKAKSYASAILALLDFKKKYPDSVQLPNVHFWLGDAQLAVKDYGNAIANLEKHLELMPKSSKAADALLLIATAQQANNQIPAAKKTLKNLIASYPSSDAAGKAKARLATLK